MPKFKFSMIAFIQKGNLNAKFLKSPKKLMKTCKEEVTRNFK